MVVIFSADLLLLAAKLERDNANSNTTMKGLLSINSGRVVEGGYASNSFVENTEETNRRPLPPMH